jgi:pimeloyl-ACP methyl ester carboxylesterase
MPLIKNKLSVFSNGDPANPPVIFVHGFPFDHNMWHYQINSLSANYYCISYDIRGLGESPVGDGQFTMEMFADDLHSLIYEMNLKNPVLCGLSMGGYISLRAVEKNAAVFSSLILCDTKSAADNDEAKLKRAAGIKKINVEGVKNFIEEFIPNCFAEESIKRLGSDYNELVKRSSGFSAEGIKGSLLAMVGRTDTTEFLSELKIPVLLICGEKDKLTPPHIMKDVADAIPDSEFHIVPGAGHLTPLEKPSAVNKIIKDFLTRSLVT